MSNNDRYIELLKQFPPRAIESEEDYEATAVVVDKLLDKQELNKEESEYLNLLGELIYFYEQVTNPVFDNPSDVKFKYAVIIRWSIENDCYVVRIPRLEEKLFGEWHAHGNSYKEALQKGLELITIVGGVALEEGTPMPEPDTVN